MQRKLLSLAGCAIAFYLLVGCLPTLPMPVASGEQEFRPELFFADSTRGRGTLHFRGRSAREVRVESFGTVQSGGRLRLDQTIRIGDDPPQTRSWTMYRESSGDYSALLTDASGPVTLTINGSELRIRYRMGAVSYMSQRLVLRPDGHSAMNHATVTILGIPWARLEEEIVRVG